MPVVVWPEEDDIYEFPHFHIGHLDSCIVFEEDEGPEVLRSRLVKPDGSPIFYEAEDDRQHYIGFIPPEYLTAIAERKLKRKLKKK